MDSQSPPELTEAPAVAPRIRLRWLPAWFSDSQCLVGGGDRRCRIRHHGFDIGGPCFGSDWGQVEDAYRLLGPVRDYQLGYVSGLDEHENTGPGCSTAPALGLSGSCRRASGR